MAGGASTSIIIRAINETREVIRDVQNDLTRMANFASKITFGFLAVDQLADFAKGVYETTERMSALNATFTAIEGNSAEAKKRLDFLLDTSRKLGLSFMDTAESAKGFFAAGKGTALEGDLEKIFTAFTKAGNALSVSSNEMNGIFLALSQMLGKATISAGDFKIQLGEKLPGAMRIAAEVMGVTTGELENMMAKGELLTEDLLPKMADALENKFGKAVDNAATTGTQAINRLSTEWDLLRSNLTDNSAMIAAVSALTSALQGLNNQLTGVARKQAILAKGGFTMEDLKDPSKLGGMASFLSGEVASRAKALGGADNADVAFVQKMLDAVNARQGSLVNGYDGSQEQADAWAQAGTKRKAALKKAAENAQKEAAKAVSEAQKQFGKAFSQTKSGQIEGLRAQQKAAAEQVALLMAGAPEDRKKELSKQLADINAYYNERIAGLSKVPGGVKSKSSGGGGSSKAREAGIMLSSLIEKINRLEMTDEEFSEWKLNEELSQMAGVLGEDNELLQRYAAAAREAFGEERRREIESLQENINRLKMPDAEFADWQLNKELEELRKKLGEDNPLIAEYAMLMRGAADAEKKAADDLKQFLSTGDQIERFTEKFSDYYKQAMDWGSQLEGVLTGAIDGAADAFVEFCSGGKVNFAEFTASILKDIAKIAARMAIITAIEGIGGLFVPGFKLSSHANGNVFSGGNLSAYSNSIVTSPTLFGYGNHVSAYASGAGLMGEAGPEAILPLRRSSDGSLGVMGAGGNVSVNIINSTGEKVSQRQRTDSAGNKTIDVYVGDMAAKQMMTPGSTLNRAVSSQTGASRPTVRR